MRGSQPATTSVITVPVDHVNVEVVVVGLVTVGETLGGDDAGRELPGRHDSRAEKLSGSRVNHRRDHIGPPIGGIGGPIVTICTSGLLIYATMISVTQ